MNQKKPKKYGNYQKKQSKDYCKFSYLCPHFINKKCNFMHQSTDSEKFNIYCQITKNKATIVVLDNTSNPPQPICLFCNILPIQISDPIQSGIYYKASFTGMNKDIVILRIEEKLGEFGNIQQQTQIMRQYKEKLFQLSSQSKQGMKFGKIDVNWSYTKVLKGQGIKKYLTLVNQRGDYPLLHGCKVRYKNDKRFQIGTIQYPKQRITGRLQVDPKGILYIIGRNMKYDDHNPYNIPQQLFEEVQPLKKLSPYSIIKDNEISIQLQDQINQSLKKYLVKGEFHSWPEQSHYPIASLDPDFELFSYKSLKDAIIYELNIHSVPATQQQIKKSKKIVSDFNIKKLKGRKLVSDPVYAIDNKNTRCYDDAFSIKTQGDDLEVSIHVADVAQLIDENNALDRELQKKDQTVYIKGYYSPMLTKELIKLFTLCQGAQKLAYTLTFLIDKRGLIDFNSIKFRPSIITVQKNYSHHNKLALEESLGTFFELGKRIEEGGIVNSEFFIEESTKSAQVINKMIYLSGMIPTALAEFSQQKIVKCKEEVDKIISQLLQNIRKKIKQWDILEKEKKKAQTQEKKLKKQQQAIMSKVNQELNGMRKKLKQQNRGNKSISDIPMNLTKMEIKDLQEISVCGSSQINQSEEEEQRLNQLREKREEKINQIMKKKISKIQESDDMSSSSSDQSDFLQEEEGLKKLKKQAAQGGFKYVSKIFNYFKIPMEWYRPKDIEEAFRKLLSQKKSDIFQHYIKRIQIMNRQHFRYWLKDKPAKQDREGTNKIMNSQIAEVNRKVTERQRRGNPNRNKKKFQEKKEQPHKRQTEEEEKGEKKRNREMPSTTNQEMPSKIDRKLSSKIEQPKGIEKILEEIKIFRAQLDDKNLMKIENVKRAGVAIKNGKLFYNKYYHNQKIIGSDLIYREAYEEFIDTEDQRKMIGQLQKEQKVMYLTQKINKICLTAQSSSIFPEYSSYSVIPPKYQKINPTNTQKEAQQLLARLNLRKINFESILDEFYLYWSSLTSTQIETKPIILKKQLEDISFRDFVTEEELEKFDLSDKYYYGKYKIIEIAKAMEKIERQKHRQLKNRAEIQIHKNQQEYKQELSQYELDEERIVKEYFRIGNGNELMYGKLVEIREREMEGQKLDEQSVKTYKIRKLKLLWNLYEKQKKKEKKEKNKQKNQRKVEASKEEKHQLKQEPMIQKQEQQVIKSPLISTQETEIPIQKHDQLAQKPASTENQKQEKSLQQKQPASTENQKQEKSLQQKQPASTENQKQEKSLQQKQPASTENQKQEKSLQQKQPASTENQKLQEQEATNTAQASQQKREKEDQKGKQKQLKLEIEKKLTELKKQLEEKHGLNEVKQKNKERLNQLRQCIKQKESTIKDSLKGVQQNYNLLDWIVAAHNNQKGKSQKKKSKKKKSKKQKKSDENQTMTVIEDILDLVDDYCKAFKCKLKKLTDQEIEDFLKSKINPQTHKDQQSLNEANNKFKNLFTNWNQSEQEFDLLKWNNPIRSYAALRTLRMLKNYEWVFNGQLNPLDVLAKFKQLKQLKDQLKRIKQFKLEKKALGQEKKDLKEANREIEKLDFYYSVKDKKDKIFKFLNIGSPTKQVKFVYHEILNEVEVDNSNFQQEMYEEVKGKVKIISEFPIEIKIQLIK